MILPAVLYYFIFSYIPMGGIIIAFKNYDYNRGILNSPWVKFENFRFFFISGQAMRITLNTIGYNIAFIIVNILFQVTTAILLSEVSGKYFKKTTQTLLLLPYFISWVVAGAIMYNLFDYNTGVVNSFLKSIGMMPVDVYNNTKIWPYLIIIFRVWKDLGYGTIIYLASITNIPQEMYESADIDGASIFQKIYYITLPYLKPIIIILVLLSLGRIVKGDFAMFYNITGNSAMLYDVTDVIDTFVYRSLQQNQDFGMAAAAGVYQSVLGFIIIMITNSIIKKVQPDYTLF